MDLSRERRESPLWLLRVSVQGFSQIVLVWDWNSQHRQWLKGKNLKILFLLPHSYFSFLFLLKFLFPLRGASLFSAVSQFSQSSFPTYLKDARPLIFGWSTEQQLILDYILIFLFPKRSPIKLYTCLFVYTILNFFAFINTLLYFELSIFYFIID